MAALKQILRPGGPALLWLLTAGYSAGSILELTDAGVAAVRQQQIGEPKAHSTTPGFYLEGYFLDPRDPITDVPTLKYPGKYVMFHPSGGKDSQLEWAWLKQTYYQMDTLSDLRRLMSNRDLRYATGADALLALQVEIDPDGSLWPQAPPPAVADDKIVPREGRLSQYLLLGPLSPADRSIIMLNSRALPPDDPLSYSLLDARFQVNGDGGNALFQVLNGLALARKYGDTEAGIGDSCRAVARFLVDTLYVSPAGVPVTVRDKATRISYVVLAARRGLLSSLESVGINTMIVPPKFAAASGLALFSPHDSPRPLDSGDLAKAALEVLALCPTPRKTDEDDVLSALIGAAACRSDFAAAGTPKPIAPSMAAAANAVGQNAFTVLLQLASPPKDGSPDLGIVFRRALVNRALFLEQNARQKAAREALVEAGIGDQSEIEPLLYQALTDGMGNRFNQAAADNVAYIVHQLPGHLADPALLSLYQTSYARHLSEMQMRQKAGDGDWDEQQFINRMEQNP